MNVTNQIDAKLLEPSRVSYNHGQNNEIFALFPNPVINRCQRNHKVVYFQVDYMSSSDLEKRKESKERWLTQGNTPAEDREEEREEES